MSFSEKDPRRWFLEKRFGMFLHWGIYSVGGKHEQEQWRYHIPAAEYEKYAERFCPDAFDPAAWIDLAQETGMEYLVFTAKHHDGFCMWNTAQTPFNVMNTPYRSDVLHALAAECRRRDFPLELYYSCVDWHHPAYPNLGRHHEILTDPGRHDMGAYMEFVKRQIRELCTGYGRIHGIWWDMNVPGWRDPSVNALIRELQPYAVINNRGYDDGDYSTPEREVLHDGVQVFRTPTEACESIGMNSWGYREDEDYFSLLRLQRQIALYLALGGNFLLNAGPDSSGAFPEKALRLLRGIGNWYRRVGKALTAAPCPEIPEADGVLCTRSADGCSLNLIFLNPPAGETVRLPGIALPPVRAELLNTGEAVTATLEPMVYSMSAPPALRLRHLPVERMYDEIQVVRLTYPEPFRKFPAPETAEPCLL